VSTLDVCGSTGAADRERKSMNGELEPCHGIGRFALASDDDK
jgi:hypothetical protein